MVFARLPAGRQGLPTKLGRLRCALRVHKLFNKMSFPFPICVISVMLVLTFPSARPTLLLSGLAYAFEVKGLRTPESFIVDPSTGAYFMSNIDGKPTQKDNNGFITKLDKTGKIIKLKFVEGGKKGVTLHAPKGLAVIDSILYATDIDFVRGFDKETGEPVSDLVFTEYGSPPPPPFTPHFLGQHSSSPHPSQINPKNDTQP